MTKVEKYLGWMEEYFDDKGLNSKIEMVQYHNGGNMIFAWNSMRYGRIGMQVRNYMRKAHPEIDIDFPNYGDFEDYSWELIMLLVQKWKQDKDIMCKKCGRVFGSVKCFDVDCPNNTPKK